MEVELNLFYELFYTKVVVMYSKPGCLARFISWSAVVAAFSIFYSIDKHDLDKIDVGITYTLLFGAIGVDMIALIMLVVSDWTIVYIQKFLQGGNLIAALLRYFLTLKRTKLVTVPKSMSNTSSLEVSTLGCFDWLRKFSFRCLDWIRKFSFRCFDWARGMLFWRWSGSVHTYNFIGYCLKEHHRRNHTILGQFTMWISVVSCLKYLYHSVKHVSKEPLEEKLWDFIFTELKIQSNLAYDSNSNSRSEDRNLLDSNLNNPNSELMSYFDGFDYHKSLLIWHIATDLCHSKEEDISSDNDCRDISKTLSDYMLYLLVMHPTLVFAILGIIKIRFQDTCAYTKAFFSLYSFRNEGQKEKHKKACEVILSEGDLKTPPCSGDYNTFVLLQARDLAKELQKLESSLRWKLIGKVWVELLSYAASHCRAELHVGQLSKGGELITFVWLLMAHLGLADELQSYTRIAKIVAKNVRQSLTVESDVEIEIVKD